MKLVDFCMKKNFEFVWNEILRCAQIIVMLQTQKLIAYCTVLKINL